MKPRSAGDFYVIRAIDVVALLLPKNGDGFTMRAFVREDAEMLAAIEFDIDVKRFLALPKKDKAQWIKSFDPESYGGWAVDVGGVLAGRASILRGKRRGDCELAIVISKPFWGLKLGRKVATMLVYTAFDELDARALVAEVHPENRASIALLRALKFRRRGLVTAPPEHWQHGHFLYRMSRGSYNKSAQVGHAPAVLQPSPLCHSIRWPAPPGAASAPW